MNTSLPTRRQALHALASTAFLGLAGCGGSSSVGQKNFAVSLRTLNNPFFVDLNTGLQQVIEAKVEGHEVKQPEQAQPTAGTVVDLMAALRASVEAAKQGRTEPTKPTKVADKADKPAKPAKKAAAKKAPAKASAAKAATKPAAAGKKAPAKKASARKSA